MLGPYPAHYRRIVRPGMLRWGAADRAHRSSAQSHVAIYLGAGQMIQAPETGENVEVVPADTGSEFAWAIRADPGAGRPVVGSI